MTPRRTTTWAAALATGLLITLAGTAPAEAAGAARGTAGCADVQVSAHRGQPTTRITENTVESFQRAVSGGARSVETDLRLTSDGVWVLMHDGTVQRTTTGAGRVARMTVAQIKALRTNGGQRVPTLDEAMAALPDGVSYQLEFKTERITDAQLMQVINKARAAEGSFLTSRFTSVLRRLSTLAPDVPRGLITVKRERPAPADIPSYVSSINISQTVADPAYIRRVHARGKEVLARYADQERAWARLVSDGIDRIVTGNAIGYARWCYS